MRKRELKIHKSHMYELKIHRAHFCELKDCKIRKVHVVRPKSDDTIVQPVVEDPVDHVRILVEAGAEPIPAPCERSELDKVKHELTHISFKHCCTLCVKGVNSTPHTSHFLVE